LGAVISINKTEHSASYKAYQKKYKSPPLLGVFLMWLNCYLIARLANLKLDHCGHTEERISQYDNYTIATLGYSSNLNTIHTGNRVLFWEQLLILTRTN